MNTSYRSLLAFISIAFILQSCMKSNDTPQCNNGFTLAQDKEQISQYLQQTNEAPAFSFDEQAKIYYSIEHAGVGENKPTIDSLVSFRFQGKLLNGTIVDSATVKEPPTQPLRSYNNLVYGVYALTKLTKGGKIKLIIPSSSAFGCTQMQGINVIPSNSQLIYEYELTDMRRSF